MRESLSMRDLELLGLGPEATRAEILEACQRRRGLYGGENPATYSLMGDEERDRILSRIDGILSRLNEVPPPPSSPPAPVGKAGELMVEGAAEIPAEPAPDPENSPGEFLRYSRLRLRKELSEISSETRISRRQLQALEEEDGSLLPAPVFVRGFVIAFARALNLEDPESLARMYLEKLGGSAS